MFAIFKREFRAYFTSPLGYVFLAIFYAFSGLFFYIFALSVGSTDISSVFLMMFMVLMVFVPLLTMRLLSEDKKQKTDQLTLKSFIDRNGQVSCRICDFCDRRSGHARIRLCNVDLCQGFMASHLGQHGRTVTARRYICFYRSVRVIAYGKPDDSGNRQFLYQSYDTAYEHTYKRTSHRIFTGRAFEHFGIFEILADNKRNIQSFKPDILCQRYLHFPVLNRKSA